MRLVRYEKYIEEIKSELGAKEEWDEILIKMFNVFTYQRRLKDIEDSKPKDQEEVKA